MLIIDNLEQLRRGEFPEVVDSTIIAAWRRCNTYAYWTHVRNLRGRGGSTDLIAGGAFAKGLEVIRQSFWGDQLPWSECIRRGMSACLAEYGDHVPMDKKMNKAPERVLAALEDYFTRWPIQTDPIQPYMWDERKPGVEFRFAIPLPIMHPVTGNPIIYGGRVDLLGLYNGQIFVVDEKTTSSLGATWGNKWTLRGQFTGYVWAARQTGLQVAGAIVRGVAFLKTQTNFAESIQFRSQFDIDQWYEQLLVDLEEFVTAWKLGRYKQDFADGCEGYNGCAFQKFCKSDQPESHTVGYDVIKWNPLEFYPYGRPKEPVGGEVVDITGMFD